MVQSYPDRSPSSTHDLAGSGPQYDCHLHTPSLHVVSPVPRDLGVEVELCYNGHKGESIIFVLLCDQSLNPWFLFIDSISVQWVHWVHRELSDSLTDELSDLTDS